MLELFGDDQGRKPDLKFVEQNTNFEQLINVIKFYLQSFATARGLPMDTFQFEHNRTGDVTATEIYVNEKHLKEMQQHQKWIFQKAEKEIFSISLKLLKNVKEILPKELDEKCFTVEFIDTLSMVKTLAPQEAILAYNANLIDRVEFTRNIYPTLNRNEAEQFVVEQIETQARVNKAEADVTPDEEKLDAEENSVAIDD